jgi:hypothetical protein
MVERNVETVAEENPEKKLKRGQSRKIKTG